jgi:dolichol-phosphate mannosyltransferase
MWGGCGYTLASMKDAIKPGPETPSQAGLPELSVVVPTFNDCDNVTVLYRRLEATLAETWGGALLDQAPPLVEVRSAAEPRNQGAQND